MDEKSSGLSITLGVISCVALLATAYLLFRPKTSSDCGDLGKVRNALRELGKAATIYAADHNDTYPEATDIWDYEKILANTVFHGHESALDGMVSYGYGMPGNEDFIVTENRMELLLSSEYKARTALNFAVPIVKITMDMPATTPIAWTRGLRTDGTWSDDGVYGKGKGGYIVFLAGNVVYFQDLKGKGGELTRFNGTGKTSNILEALPPGATISETLSPEQLEARAAAK